MRARRASNGIAAFTKGHPDDAAPVFLGSAVRIDAVTLRLSARVPRLAYDLWPATDEARNAQAAALAAAVTGATVADVGPGKPFVPPDPASIVDPFEAFPVAVTQRVLQRWPGRGG